MLSKQEISRTALRFLVFWVSTSTPCAAYRSATCVGTTAAIVIIAATRKEQRTIIGAEGEPVGTCASGAVERACVSREAREVVGGSLRFRVSTGHSRKTTRENPSVPKVPSNGAL